MTKFDMMGAIDYIDTAFRAGKFEFFIDTTFGRIAVEQVISDFDQLDPTEVSSWQYAPRTSFTMRNRSRSCDYYVSIGVSNNSTRRSIHIHVIEAMCKLMLLATLGEEFEQDIVDAAVTIYLHEIEGQTLSLNFMEKEFTRVNLDNIIIRNSTIVKNLAVDHIQRRMDASAKVVVAANNLMNEYQKRNIGRIDFRVSDCISDYKDLFGIILYCLQSNPDLHLTINRDSYSVIIDRTETYGTIPRIPSNFNN